jgi:uncharacterized protein (TIGR02246 family)
MRQSLRAGAVIACLIALSACGRKVDRKQEEQKLMETSRAWSRAVQSGDVEAILAYWADDAVVIQPATPTMRNKAQLRAYLEKSLKVPGFRISWEPREASLSDDGTLGYLIEETEVSMTGPDAKPIRERYRGVTIWRKQADGSWRNVVDMTNEEPAAVQR